MKAGTKLLGLVVLILSLSACHSDKDISGVQQELFANTVWKGKIDMERAVLPVVINKKEQHYYVLTINSKYEYSVYMCDSNGVNVLYKDSGTCKYDEEIAWLRFFSKEGDVVYGAQYYSGQKKLYLGYFGVGMYRQNP